MTYEEVRSMSTEDAKRWLIENDPEAKDFWESNSPSWGDVFQNLNDFGGWTDE